MRRPVAVAAALLLAVAPAAISPSASAAAGATSVTCTPSSDPSAGRTRTWSIAAARLSTLATGPRGGHPFGQTGRDAYRRTTAYAWTSGFFPASLWLMYERTRDAAWLAHARRYTDGLLPVASWTGSHDLGFTVGLPARLGAALDPSATRRARYERAIPTAATSLSARWNARVGAIRSGEYGGRWGLIIDSAMNAPLLIEAAASVGGAAGERLTARGLEHMLTLRRHFIRADGSTFHRMAFNARTGALIGPVPGQGLASGSTWARGQAWAVNGFTQAYALTGDGRMLDAARRTADYWLAHVPGGCIPAWDLDVTDDAAPRDSSAAAIAADGLLRLADLDQDAARADWYRASATATVDALTRPRWVPGRASARGILHHQTHSVPGDRREGTYVWGDTYLLLALRGLDTTRHSRMFGDPHASMTG